MYIFNIVIKRRTDTMFPKICGLLALYSIFNSNRYKSSSVGVMIILLNRRRGHVVSVTFLSAVVDRLVISRLWFVVTGHVAAAFPFVCKAPINALCERGFKIQFSI